MERFIIRSVALLCACGGLGLAWAFGAFATIPLRDGRVFAMNSAEMQLVGISLAGTLLVGWGALHLLGLADRESSPRGFAAARAGYAVALVAAAVAGGFWSSARVLA